MVSISDEAIIFFQNSIAQMVLIVGGLITSLKYLDHKQSNKIKDETSKQLNPFMMSFKDQLQEMKSCLELQQQATLSEIKRNDLQIEYLEKAIMRIQTMEETKELRRYRLEQEKDYEKREAKQRRDSQEIQ